MLLLSLPLFFLIAIFYLLFVPTPLFFYLPPSSTSDRYVSCFSFSPFIHLFFCASHLFLPPIFLSLFLISLSVSLFCLSFPSFAHIRDLCVSFSSHLLISLSFLFIFLFFVCSLSRLLAFSVPYFPFILFFTSLSSLLSFSCVYLLFASLFFVSLSTAYLIRPSLLFAVFSFTSASASVRSSLPGLCLRSHLFVYVTVC